MQLYDTARAQLVTPDFPATVRLYVCGITPYDAAHMGHMFTFLTYDILQRYLEYKGRQVQLVRNITDVDEPIYAKAAELGVPYTKLAADETAHFQDVMRQMNMRPAYAEPKASDYIDKMITAVEQLLSQKQAYQLENGDVYFDVTTFPHFGHQSGLSERLQLAFMASRGGDPERPDKRNPLDFLLWKAVPDETDPARWESPFGFGRPGWHIECSVMAADLLDTPLDIHGGGMDLIFPHHACEIAQSKSLRGGQFANHWMHVAPLYCYGEKMSKSLGNLVFARDVLQSYEPAVVRLALLRYHYRIGGEWQDERLDEAKELYAQVSRALASPSGPDASHYLAEFLECLDDDLYTPLALHVLKHLACDTTVDPKPTVTRQAALKAMLDILGIPA